MNRYFYIFLLCLSFQALSETPRVVELKGFHYLSEPGSSLQLKDYFSLYSNLNYETEKNNLFFKANGLGEFFFDKTQQFYFNIPEMYLSYDYDLKIKRFVESIKVYVGRHIKTWSQADEYWELGTWNPLNLWDPVHPSQNGLVGAFLDVVSKNWILEFYVGGIHLPNVEPVLKNDKKTGQILAPSRWKFPLYETAIVRGIELDINYLVDVFFERFLHDSYILSLKTWAYENQNLWLKGSFGYKPVNAVFVVANNKDRLKVSDSNGTKESPVNIQQNIENYPVIQRIWSLEGGVRYDGLSALLSVSDNKVRPLKGLSKGDEFVIKPFSHTYFSGLASYKFDLYKDINTKFQIGYLHSLGKKDGIFSSNALYHKLLRGMSFDWTVEALSAEGLKRTLSLRYWHSLEKWGSLFSLNVLCYLLPKWYVGGRINILAGEKEKEPYSFLGKFRHNDYLSWRTGYVF